MDEIKQLLQVGMEFKNMRALCSALGIKYHTHSTKNRKIIEQYCKFHYRNKNHVLIIDEIYDEIKKVNFLCYEYKFDVGEILDRKYGQLKIEQKIRIKNKNGSTTRGYHVICLVCGYEFDITEHHLLEGCGCSVCSCHKVLKKYNDMWTTNPNLAKLLLNSEDGYKYTENSNKRVDWKCPICGAIIQNKIIEGINKNGLSCSKCGDGISYPNKFMYNLLNQLEINFECEKQFNWCKFKKFHSNKNTYGLYDFVIEDYKIIIEMDSGLGHGNTTYNNEISVDETLYRDHCKDQLAIENGYTILRIPCNYNDLSIRYEVCKKATIDILSNIFDLQNIDWYQVHTDSLNSMVMKICQLYNEGYSTFEISQLTKISVNTVIDYLKQGTIGGFCNYKSQIKFNKQFLINQGYTNLNSKNDVQDAKLDFLCNYYNAHHSLTAEQIAHQLGISNVTVWKFLKRGTEFGYCNYIPKDTRFKVNHIYHKHEILQ